MRSVLACDKTEYECSNSVDAKQTWLALLLAYVRKRANVDCLMLGLNARQKSVLNLYHHHIVALVEDKPLGLTTTPLSGHFNQSYLGDNSTLPYCNETFLVSEFDGDIGRIIWKARDAIPQFQ